MNSSNAPLISVVTVSYNAVNTIEETILSVINQTYPNIEYIIIDGESTDGTVDVIKKYADRIAYWVSEPDKGIYDAMNKGIKVALGDFFFFLGADDLFYSATTLLDLHEVLKEKDTIYYGDVIFIPSLIKYGGGMNKLKFCIKNICHQAIFYPKSVFEKYQYDTSCIIYADYYLNLQCFIDNRFRFQYFGKTVSFFNENGKSSSKIDVVFTDKFYKIIYSNFGLFYFIYSKLRLGIHSLKSTQKKNGTI